MHITTWLRVWMRTPTPVFGDETTRSQLNQLTSSAWQVESLAVNGGAGSAQLKEVGVAVDNQNRIKARFDDEPSFQATSGLCS